jgi:hypothetical protein
MAIVEYAGEVPVTGPGKMATVRKMVTVTIFRIGTGDGLTLFSPVEAPLHGFYGFPAASDEQALGSGGGLVIDPFHRP